MSILISQVSYEYIACQQERNGVMILSEFAGAAQCVPPSSSLHAPLTHPPFPPSLSSRSRSLNGSLIVNPWDKFAVADAIHESLTMPAEVRKANFEKLSRYVGKHTASWWGMSFVQDLRRIQVGQMGGEE